MGASNFMAFLREMRARANFKYSAIPSPTYRHESHYQEQNSTARNQKLLKMSMGAIVFLLVLYMTFAYGLEFCNPHLARSFANCV